jgi:hypothetical protein
MRRRFTGIILVLLYSFFVFLDLLLVLFDVLEVFFLGVPPCLIVEQVGIFYSVI